MNALEVFERILDNDNLLNSNLKYCFVDENKFPHKLDGSLVRPNVVEDFIDIKDISFDDIDKIIEYKSLGISIQGSNICAIDVDHCFNEPFNFETADERAIDIYNRFKDVAYIEFSFSGSGMRILFKNDIISNYKNNYYIKNSKKEIEYYQPSLDSYRYVTLTGKYLSNNLILTNQNISNIVFNFLNDYMKREPLKLKTKDDLVTDNRTISELIKKVKYFYLTNARFQDVWFSKAPGSNSDESERDYYLISFLYENVVKDKEKLRLLFEESPFFKSKDSKHVYKWNYSNHRYYDYIYERI